MTVVVDLFAPSRADLVVIAGRGEAVEVGSGALERLERRGAAIDAMLDRGTPVYGLSTGFGALATRPSSRPSSAATCSAR